MKLINSPLKMVLTALFLMLLFKTLQFTMSLQGKNKQLYFVIWTSRSDNLKKMKKRH